MKTRSLWVVALVCASLGSACGGELGEEAALRSEGTNLILGDSSYEGWTGEALPEELPEQERVRTHLAYVEQRLRLAPTGHLDEASRQARQKNLDRLRDYWVAGDFPHNDGHPDARRPVFVDDQGAVCAVGHLIAQDLGREAIEPIAQQEKYDFIAEIEHPALSQWQQTSGLSMRELAMIQPSYHWQQPRPEPPSIRRDLQRLQRRAQARINQCVKDRHPDQAPAGVNQFQATLTWDKEGRVVAVGTDLRGLAPELESCLRQSLESMALQRLSHYGQHTENMTQSFRFTLPRPQPPAPTPGPSDLDQGLHAIQVRAASCFAHSEGPGGSWLVPMTVAINNGGKVAWARIAPQHLLRAPLNQGQVHGCLIQAAQSQSFASYQGPLLEAHLHIQVPEVHP